jgi:hypothetical protein
LSHFSSTATVFIHNTVVELVRYRPGEAIRWLQTGAETMRKTASTRSRDLVRQSGADQKGFGENVKTAAGALYDFGKSAYADVVRKHVETSEFVLQEDHFDMVHNGSIKTIPYSRVKQVTLTPERARLMLDKGSVSIKPVAFVLAGHLKVPGGWVRNGIEVPFDLLIEELAARCGLEVDAD